VINASTPPATSQPIAHRTRYNLGITNSNAMVVSPPNTVRQSVAFSLPPTHVDKYSEAYRHLTPARLQLARENTPWKQSPVHKNWMERSSTRTHHITLPAALHNNQFALLADDEDDNIDND
jgi:hypothetical protein